MEGDFLNDERGKVSFVMLTRSLLDLSCRWGLVARRLTVIREIELSVLRPASREGRGAAGSISCHWPRISLIMFL